MERAYEAGTGPELKEEERDNSIFVSAFKRHLQSGSLRERLDTLLTDAAAGELRSGGSPTQCYTTVVPGDYHFFRQLLLCSFIPLLPRYVLH